MQEGINRLITIFQARDEVTPVLNEMSGGLTNFARRSESVTSRAGTNVGLLGREWEKFGRTFGYAIAGFGTYAIFNAIRNVKGYQEALGALDARLQTTPGNLDELGRAAIRISTATATPLDEVQQSINNLAQSFPNLRRSAELHFFPTVAKYEAMGARVSGIDPFTFGSVLSGTARAFFGINRISAPGGENLIRGTAGQISRLALTTPRLQGTDLGAVIPMLTGGAIPGRFNISEMLGLFQVAQQAGGARPTQTAQYLRQLMLRLRAPTKAEQPFFAQAGLAPNQLSNMTGMQILNTLFSHVLSLPGAQGLQGMSPSQIKRLFSQGNQAQLHVQGPAADFLRGAIGGRIQSLIAATALLRNVGAIPGAVRGFQGNQAGQELEQRFTRQMQQVPWTRFSQSLSNATTAMLLNFNPAINPAASALASLASKAQSGSEILDRVGRRWNREILGAHAPNVIGGGLQVGGTVAALIGGVAGARLLRGGIGGLFREGGRFARLGGGGGALSGAFRGEATTAAAVSALEGKATGTYSAPFWVVIHPLSKYQVPEMFGGGRKIPGTNTPTGGSGGLFGFVKKHVEGIGAAGIAAGSRFPGLAIGAARGAALLAPLAAETPALGDIIQMIEGKDPFPYPKNDPRFPGYKKKILPVHEARLARAQRQRVGNLAQSVEDIFSTSTRRETFTSRAHMGALAQGSVEATFNLEPTPELRRILRPQTVKAHVPVTLWNQGSPAPTERGKPKVTRHR